MLHWPFASKIMISMSPTGVVDNMHALLHLIKMNNWQSNRKEEKKNTVLSYWSICWNLETVELVSSIYFGAYCFDVLLNEILVLKIYITCYLKCRSMYIRVRKARLLLFSIILPDNWGRCNDQWHAFNLFKNNVFNFSQVVI